IDYCVVKWPRFAFEKFPGAEADLTTHMKSVGEAMAIGRTFKQAFAKALRSRELDTGPRFPDDQEELLGALQSPGADRFDHLLEALRRGTSIEELHRRTDIDPWFLRELAELVEDPSAPFAGERTFKSVDTCAAEFAARTPYYYSGSERPGPDGPRHEAGPGERPGVVILGSGPNRIGQGIEFDYCCVHAAMAVRESGGQTPLKLAAGLVEAGVPVLGTSVEAIDEAEDRGRFGALLERLGLRAPPYGTAHSVAEALDIAPRIGFPLLVRPSYVLGGRAMEIVYSSERLEDYLRRAAATASNGREIYLDRFL